LVARRSTKKKKQQRRNRRECRKHGQIGAANKKGFSLGKQSKGQSRSQKKPKEEKEKAQTGPLAAEKKKWEMSSKKICRWGKRGVRAKVTSPFGRPTGEKRDGSNE